MSLNWGSMQPQEEDELELAAFSSWEWWDWIIAVALAGIGWGALFAIGKLAWLEFFR